MSLEHASPWPPFLQAWRWTAGSWAEGVFSRKDLRVPSHVAVTSLAGPACGRDPPGRT